MDIVIVFISGLGNCEVDWDCSGWLCVLFDREVGVVLVDICWLVVVLFYLDDEVFGCGGLM